MVEKFPTVFEKLPQVIRGRDFFDTLVRCTVYGRSLVNPVALCVACNITELSLRLAPAVAAWVSENPKKFKLGVSETSKKLKGNIRSTSHKRRRDLLIPWQLLNALNKTAHETPKNRLRPPQTPAYDAPPDLLVG